jgi:hypothetical protein
MAIYVQASLPSYGGHHRARTVPSSVSTVPAQTTRESNAQDIRGTTIDTPSVEHHNLKEIVHPSRA